MAKDVARCGRGHSREVSAIRLGPAGKPSTARPNKTPITLIDPIGGPCYQSKQLMLPDRPSHFIKALFKYDIACDTLAMKWVGPVGRSTSRYRLACGRGGVQSGAGLILVLLLEAG